MNKNLLKVGDTIRCHDEDELLDVMRDLARAGVETDFDYEDGLKLVVTGLWEGQGEDTD